MSDIKWEAFELGKTFNIRASKSGIDKNKLVDSHGKIPYITRTDLNNGIGGYVGANQKKEYEIDQGNVITIGLDTQTVHYQESPFYTGQNIQIMEHKKMNKYVAHFLIPLIKVLMHKFTWGSTGATLTRLKRSKIVLPVDEVGRPNWCYMEQYIKEKQKESNVKAVEFLSKELKKIGDYKDVDYADIYNWEKYKINDIADVYSGNDWTYKDRVPGDTPFIGASSINNSITDYINPEVKPKYVEKNAISINRNGSIGYSFYHPYIAYFSGDTRFIKLKNNIDSNEYISLFITTTIEKQRHKYMYGYKMGTARIKNQYVMLPVQEDDKPDYEFMDNYMRKMKYERIQRLLKFLSENHNI